MSRATSLKGLVGNLRFIAAWKTWAVLIMFGAGAGVGLAIAQLSPEIPAAFRTWRPFRPCRPRTLMPAEW